MVRNEHFQKLERLYASSLSDLPSPNVSVAYGQAQLRGALDKSSALPTGTPYQALLNDVATLAAGSLEKQQMMTSETFDTEVVKPEYRGAVVASARVVLAQPPRFIVEAVVETPEGDVVAKARGAFRPSERSLPSVPDEADAPSDHDDLPPASFMPIFATPYGVVCLN
jgi:hypothetical protein